MCHLFVIIKQGYFDDCHERDRLWWLSWERKIGTGQMRERLQEVSVMGRLLSTQPIHCTPKPLCIVSRYILHCIALCGIMIHSQALNSVPKRPDGSQRLSLWLWYRLGSRQPVIIAILGVSIINIILLIDIKLTLFIIVVIIGELQYQSPLISWLMWPRPSPGVRTMPEIINRDRMSQIHTKNYHKYINTQQLWNYTRSKSQWVQRGNPHWKEIKTFPKQIYSTYVYYIPRKWKFVRDSGHKYVH